MNPKTIPLKDCWRTPPWLFAPLHGVLDFSVDAAATDADTLAPVFISPDASPTGALGVRWSHYARRPDGALGAIWNNPPYSNTNGGLYAWICKAREAAGDGCLVVQEVPPSMTTRYMKTALLEARGVVFFERRVGHLHPFTLLPAEQNRGDSCLIFWTPEGGPSEVTYIDPEDAEALRRVARVFGLRRRAAA